MAPKNTQGQQPDDYEPQVGPVGAHNSGQMAADTPHQVGTTPAMPSPDQSTNPTQDLAQTNARGSNEGGLPERAGIARFSEKRVPDRKVNPDAVRESYEEAQTDAVPELEPEDGEKAA